MNTMTAAASRMWMRPPIVYEVNIPSIHNAIKTTRSVVIMLTFLSCSHRCDVVDSPVIRRPGWSGGRSGRPRTHQTDTQRLPAQCCVSHRWLIHPRSASCRTLDLSPLMPIAPIAKPITTIHTMDTSVLKG